MWPQWVSWRYLIVPAGSINNRKQKAVARSSYWYASVMNVNFQQHGWVAPCSDASVILLLAIPNYFATSWIGRTKPMIRSVTMHPLTSNIVIRREWMYPSQNPGPRSEIYRFQKRYLILNTIMMVTHLFRVERPRSWYNTLVSYFMTTFHRICWSTFQVFVEVTYLVRAWTRSLNERIK